MHRLVLLFVISVITACTPVQKRELDPAVAAWEEDIRKLEQLDRSEQYSPNALLFAGSSSIRLWSTITKDMAPYEVIQRGYGGAKLSDFVVYADRIISAHACSAIILFIANDISGNEADKTPEEVASLFSQVLEIIRKSHPDTPVFWIEITPTPSRWHVWKQASQANARIKQICETGYRTYFISTSSEFLDESGLPKTNYFMPDMLHLNEEGYRVWSEIIKKEMKILPAYTTT